MTKRPYEQRSEDQPEGATKPTALPVLPDNVPAELKALRRWVCWRYEQRGTGWGKAPYCAHTGCKADANNPTSWASFDEALRVYRDQGFDGIGFALKDTPYTVPDLDDCLKADGTLQGYAAQFLKVFPSYAEVSPSKTGLKVFVRGHPPAGRRKTSTPRPVELLYGQGYAAVTGHRLEGSPASVQDCTKTLRQLHAALFAGTAGSEPATEKPKASQSANSMSGPSPATAEAEDSLADDAVLEKARKALGERFKALWAGTWQGRYPSQSQADLALVGYLVRWSDDPDQVDRLFRLSGLYREKWEREDYRLATITKALSNRKPVARAEETPRPPAVEPANVPEVDNDPYRLARYVLADFWHPDSPTLVNWLNEWYGWRSGSYHVLPRNEVEALAHRAIRRVFEADYNRKLGQTKSEKKRKKLRVQRVSPMLVQSTLRALESLRLPTAAPKAQLLIP